MIIGILKELQEHESRISATPETVKKIIKAEHSILVESGAGDKSFISDSEYKESGATIVNSSNDIYQKANIIFKVNPPNSEELEQLKNESTIISFFQIKDEIKNIATYMNKNLSILSMSHIPRTSLAQNMDALSSQSNIAGYKATIIGANHISKYMPLLMTAAGTIKPAKVLILGAGVAGLAAIANAKRMGAQVYAFDVRPVVKEQVESLGAKFIEVESDTDEGVGEGGYAKETSEDYKRKQQELIHDHISKADVVITTALIPGRPAPLLIPKTMVQDMRPGSVIMDLAAENGGNCELTSKDEVVEFNQVIIDGISNLPSTMPVHASALYAKNVAAFLLYTLKDGELNLDFEDEIISGALFTHQGEITHQPTEELINQSKDS